MSNFNYYKLNLKMIREMLGTCPSCDIMHEHVIEKARKQIKLANSLERKVSKKLEKYVGDDISDYSEIKELQAVLRTYMQILGKQFEIPEVLSELLELSKTLNEEIEEMIKNGETRKMTVFMRDPEGNPIISSHMILGNIKEILRAIVNSGDKTLFKSKVQLSECSALDIKPIEKFLVASQPVYPEPLVRPIRFDQMGKQVTALVASEVLPEGTEFMCTLRVRKGSNFDSLATLKFIFDHGKLLGLGQWRGSGNYGSYVFKLEHLPEFMEDFGDGWL